MKFIYILLFQAVNDGESFPLGKFRVLCISADEDMGFLINLPAPCNLLFQVIMSLNAMSTMMTIFTMAMIMSHQLASTLQPPLPGDP